VFLLVPLLALVLSVDASRLEGNPIITPETSKSIGTNINGPSLIRVPSWLHKPLGKYYLYFAHHQGKFIRLAYANSLRGPWKVYEPGTLQLAEVPACHDHIASPDVQVDDKTRTIRMYFHCPAEGTGTEIEHQKTLFADSADGLHFRANSAVLGPPYFRVFRWQGYLYAIARTGTLFRSSDGVSPFEPGPALFGEDKGHILRHAGVDVRGDVLTVYFSRIGDDPESILASEITLTPDWKNWKSSKANLVLKPERFYEGADLPTQPSTADDAPGPVRQLRDPAIFHEDDHTYLLYSIAGESGIAIAVLH
jgi:hypothetical protein